MDRIIRYCPEPGTPLSSGQSNPLHTNYSNETRRFRNKLRFNFPDDLKSSITPVELSDFNVLLAFILDEEMSPFRHEFDFCLEVLLILTKTSPN